MCKETDGFPCKVLGKAILYKLFGKEVSKSTEFCRCQINYSVPGFVK